MSYKLKEDVVVYKKVHYRGSDAVATLLLEAGTLISKPLSSKEKNRASAVKVLLIEARDRNYKFARLVDKASPYQGFARRDHPTKYVVGKVVLPHEFDKSNATCAGGIHFFRSRVDAENY